MNPRCEASKSDTDGVNAAWAVNQPLQNAASQVKLDLKPFVERHSFSFDDALDENVTNDQVRMPNQLREAACTSPTKQGRAAVLSCLSDHGS